MAETGSKFDFRNSVRTAPARADRMLAVLRKNLPRDTYPLLIANMRVVIYNGDWDACVPWTDNHAWTKGMGYKEEDVWHPWMFNQLDAYGFQVGGYAINYAVDKGNFTFITIRGGRHEVPETAPKRAFEMFSRLVESRGF